MFPCLISKAAIVDVINNGEGPNKNGAVQLMFAVMEMLTRMVPTREVYFVKCCKQLSLEQWVVVGVSIDKVEHNINTSLIKCRKRPSGCIIEDKVNRHCKVVLPGSENCDMTNPSVDVLNSEECTQTNDPPTHVEVEVQETRQKTSQSR